MDKLYILIRHDITVGSPVDKFVGVYNSLKDAQDAVTFPVRWFSCSDVPVWIGAHTDGSLPIIVAYFIREIAVVGGSH